MTTDTEAPPLVARSLSGQPWRLRAVDERAVEAVAREMDIPQVLARLLLARGIAPEQAQDYLNPSLKASLPDPSHLKDMDAAAERIASAIIADEKIAVFGDYDVDGATSSALLALFFRMLGREALIYIPDRITEGYGPNTAALMQLKARGASVVITVDCGTLAFAPLEAAHEAGLDVIVIDHHMGEARRPKCFALVNPNRADESSPHRHLAAVGVAFLLAVAVTRALRKGSFFATRAEPDLISLLDLVALGTVCDVVSLTGINRAFAAQGFKIMGARGNLGVATLMDVGRVDEHPNAYTCGFILGPRVNAGGRVGKAEYGARLLSTHDEAEAQRLAHALDQYNTERKAIEAMVLEEALAQAEAQALDYPLLLIAGRGWHPGVIGIVAGRVKERFGLPAAIIALEGGVGKASARSVNGFDFGASVIAAMDSGLLIAGGGHAMAAGFTVAEEHIPALHAFLLGRLHSTGNIAARGHAADACIALSGANLELAHALSRAAPFGQGNPGPRLMLQNAKVAAVDTLANGHLRLALTDEGRTRLTAMAFRAEGTPLGRALVTLPGKRIHALCQVKLSTWQGQERVSLTLEDAALV